MEKELEQSEDSQSSALEFQAFAGASDPVGFVTR